MTENTEAAPTATAQAPAPEKPAAVTTPAPEAPKAAPVVEAKPEAAPKVAEKKDAVAPDTKQDKKQTLTPTDFFKQRDEKREKKAQEKLADLEKQFADYRAQVEAAKTGQAPAKAEADAPSLLDNPDEWAKSVEARAEKRAIEAYEARIREAQSQAAYRQANEQAAGWLLTRKHLKEDRGFLDEVATAIENDHADIAGVNPEKAARLAYMDVCAKKGVAPDIEGFVAAGGLDATQGAASASVRPSNASGGKKIWTRAEANAYLMAAVTKPGEFKSRESEIDEAKREGRIK